ncbi:hypothetical protein A2634_02770 [Candidatus Amesbacteria bacterium RIFCSPHIGHO2_01_FULL_48_32]|nr:MAG: hypothetical protein A2634_02770 [Candidatus Amesbacteria bacterium RIFCSPHIGHO2_01_FULL_48_32]
MKIWPICCPATFSTIVKNFLYMIALVLGIFQTGSFLIIRGETIFLIVCANANIDITILHRIIL